MRNSQKGEDMTPGLSPGLSLEVSTDVLLAWDDMMQQHPEVSDLLALVDTREGSVTVLERETFLEILREDLHEEPEPSLLRPAEEASPPMTDSLAIWVVMTCELIQVRMTKQHLVSGGDA